MHPVEDAGVGSLAHPTPAGSARPVAQLGAQRGPADAGGEHEGDALAHVPVGARGRPVRPCIAGFCRRINGSNSAHSSSLVSRGGGEGAGEDMPNNLRRSVRTEQSPTGYFCNVLLVMEAYLHGVSTRKVDELVRALGADTRISTSEVSGICADLAVHVTAFDDRSLADPAVPYVSLDATYCKPRVDRRVVSRAVLIATRWPPTGTRAVLGFAVGDAEHGAVWTAFLCLLKARGLAGTQRVISHAHIGHKQAISGGAARRQLAAVPGALHAERPGPGTEGQRRDGGPRDPHHLRLARCRARARPTRGDRRHAQSALPAGRADALGRRRRPAGLHRLVDRALEDLVDQFA